MENREIAAILEEISNLMKIIQEDPKWPFKSAAYDRAKRSIESHPERMEDLARSSDRKLTDIPGVGEDIARKIKELVETGRSEYHQALLKKVPNSLLDLLHLQSIGPQKIRLFYTELNITTIDELAAAAKAGRLRGLAKMNVKSEENILKAIEDFQKGGGRFLISTAFDIATHLGAYLRESKLVEEVTPAGSFRRGCETVGDLDLIVIGRDHATIAEHFTGYPDVLQVLATGEDKVSVKLKNGMQVDVRLLEPECYGAALLYFTGSKEHNVALRDRVKRQGWKLNEYGLFKGDTRIAGRTEEEIYKKMGLDWIPPEIRENQGEVEAAGEGRLPKLVELADIKGDLHIHTTASDGKNSVEQMADAAKNLGYRYMLITDHSQSLVIAGGLNEERALENIQRVRAARTKVKDIQIWAGAEVDILADGKLDYPDELLKQFDVVVASVHSRMKQSPEEMTARLLKALDNPYLRILGHPTGRRLLRREPFLFDPETVFERARKLGVTMEVNSSPERLDLCDRHVRLARDKGMKIMISTDAHRPEHYRYMRFGVTTARRGWMESKGVLNTLPPEKLLASLRPLPKS